jgi:hypothetical protein
MSRVRLLNLAPRRKRVHVLLMQGEDALIVVIELTDGAAEFSIPGF